MEYVVQQTMCHRRRGQKIGDTLAVIYSIQPFAFPLLNSSHRHICYNDYDQSKRFAKMLIVEWSDETATNSTECQVHGGKEGVSSWRQTSLKFLLTSYHPFLQTY